MNRWRKPDNVWRQPPFSITALPTLVKVTGTGVSYLVGCRVRVFDIDFCRRWRSLWRKTAIIRRSWMHLLGGSATCLWLNRGESHGCGLEIKNGRGSKYRESFAADTDIWDAGRGIPTSDNIEPIPGFLCLTQTLKTVFSPNLHVAHDVMSRTVKSFLSLLFNAMFGVSDSWGKRR